MKVVLLGPPGAGKGTQAKVLSQRLAVAHISTGDIFREEVQKGTVLGREVKACMDKGELVPDEIVVKAIEARLNKGDSPGGFILDGFPRTVPQATLLDDLLSKGSEAIDVVMYMETSVDTIIKRLADRRICGQCGAVYHLKNMPPQRAGICDKCSGELYQRKDDKEETVRRRLKVYKEHVAALIDYYRRQDKLREISGDLDVEDAYRAIFGIFTQEGLA